MERIRELLDRLVSLSDSEIAELEGLILSEFEGVEQQDPTAGTVDMMTTLADALDSVRSETSRRTLEQQELSRRAKDAASRVRAEAANKPEDTEATNKPQDVESPAEDVAEPGEEPGEPAAAAEAVPPPAAPVEAAPPAAEAPPPGETEEEKKKRLAKEAEGGPMNAHDAKSLAVEEPITEALATEPAAPETAAVEPEATATAAVETEAAPEPATTPETLAQSESTEETVTAAADVPPAEVQITPPDDRLPTNVKPAAVVTITAGADIPGISAGSELPDAMAVANAFIKRLHTLRRVTGGDGEQHIIASLQAKAPEERTLYDGDTEGNRRKIDAVVGPQAITASGGFCAPYEIRYDIFGFGDTGRPIRDTLPTFQADRGGLRWTAPPALPGGGWAGAMTLHTNAIDVAGTPAKPTLKIVCGSEQTALIEALTLSLTFGNIQARVFPEWVKANNDLSLVAHARFAELNLLTKIKAAGTAVTAAGTLGAARDWLAQVDAAAAGYRYRHRLKGNTSLRVIAPEWVKTMLRADLTMQMPGDGMDDTFALADAKINSWFRVRNINVTWAMDDVDAAHTFTQGAGALVNFQTGFEWDLFAEGTFLVLDGGTLDLGIIRDSTLVGKNDYMEFTESFENVVKVGVESIHVTSSKPTTATAFVTGAAQALFDGATLGT